MSFSPSRRSRAVLCAHSPSLVALFGLLELPKLFPTRMPGFGWTGDVHDALAHYGMLALIVLHVGAALYHYFVRRDRVPQRMLPGR